MLSANGKVAPIVFENDDPIKKLHIYTPEKGLGWNFQHLYIISNDEIKESDWYIDDANQVRRSITSDKEYWSVRKDYKKIVATTNPELWMKELDVKESRYSNDEIYLWDIPKISESFSQAYVKSYNEGKPITEIDLEMEYNTLYPMVQNNNLKIKTTPDNTVIICN